MNEASYAAAFLLGLLGNVHCVAMCGGIVGILSHREDGPVRTNVEHFAQPLLYNLGRIASYTLAGAIAGAAGLVIAESLGAKGLLGLRGLFGVLMLAAGLAIVGWSSATRVLERAAGPLWKFLSRGIAWLRPADRAWKSLLLGAIWGWLPCGLVYAALMGAVASGSGIQGALFMLAFGLGTLPALLALGALAGRLRGALTATPVRMAAGLAIAAFGIWTIAGAVMGHQHWGHATMAAHGDGTSEPGHAHHPH